MGMGGGGTGKATQVTGEGARGEDCGVFPFSKAVKMVIERHFQVNLFAFQKLFSVVMQRIKQSTAEDVFIPLIMKGCVLVKNNFAHKSHDLDLALLLPGNWTMKHHTSTCSTRDSSGCV